ncbi:hypothetical protein FIBSPDRAFT_897142 [Athelia psychrophila]|uniref:Uncharacterized protein n=1 Tax=Athelia psychrophila TaxID=1759441 RepID=A0A166CIW5_9AGAM|nr:hypothetical protein FIBSPDRAFT_897142 [Fibularhizoctonia sp. CBS 109695]
MWFGDEGRTVTSDYGPEPKLHEKDAAHVGPLQPMAPVTQPHQTWFEDEGRTMAPVTQSHQTWFEDADLTVTSGYVTELKLHDRDQLHPHQTWFEDADWTVASGYVTEPKLHDRDQEHGRTVTGDYITEPKKPKGDQEHVLALRQTAPVTPGYQSRFDDEGRTVHQARFNDEDQKVAHDYVTAPEEHRWSNELYETLRVLIQHLRFATKERHISNSISLPEVHWRSGRGGKQSRIPELVSRVEVTMRSPTSQL